MPYSPHQASRQTSDTDELDNLFFFFFSLSILGYWLTMMQNRDYRTAMAVLDMFNVARIRIFKLNMHARHLVDMYRHYLAVKLFSLEKG